MSLRNTLRFTLLILGMAIIAGSATNAFGFWSSLGSGSSETQLGDPHSLVMTPGTASAQLYPGGSATVTTVAANSNPYPVHIRSLSLDPTTGSNGFEVDGGHATCDLSALSYTFQNNDGNGWTVPPKAGDTDGTLPINTPSAVGMGIGASDACQGASFTVHLVAGV